MDSGSSKREVAIENDSAVTVQLGGLSHSLSGATPKQVCVLGQS
jgi:hypothetical protein